MHGVPEEGEERREQWSMHGIGQGWEDKWERKGEEGAAHAGGGGRAFGEQEGEKDKGNLNFS